MGQRAEIFLYLKTDEIYEYSLKSQKALIGLSEENNNVPLQDISSKVMMTEQKANACSDLNS
jgi:hypothetical protein